MTEQTPAPSAARVDLTNCDREPIHIPGSIQPHGCLLALDAAAGEVLRHSANAPAMLGLTGDPNGRPLAEVIGAEAAHALRNTLAQAGDGQRPALLFGLALGPGRFDVSAHRHLGHTILEFEPAGGALGTMLSNARTIIGRLRSIASVQRLVARAAGLIQAQLGYDRVMIYELGPDGAGKVVAEAKRPGLESFQGQYFPASDIPRQARALYVRNPIRLIGDAGYRPVPLIPERDASGEPLDLSYAHLRSVSPVHCGYLRNMGVAASMSISVIIDGQLWGLIACHHYAPRTLTMAGRAAAEMLGEFFSLHLDALRRRQALEAATAARQALDDLLIDASRGSDIGEVLRERLPRLSELMICNGAGLYIDGEWTTTGIAPGREAVMPLIRLAQGAVEGRIWASHQLGAVLPDADELTAEVAGALVIPLSQRPRDFLIHFRREAVHTLDWAGDPNKTYTAGPLGDRLTPRKSFAIWKETVRGQAHPWTEAERQFAEAIRLAVVEILLRNSELLADERTKAAIRQRMLNEELNHRVKNILAVIRSLVGQEPQAGATLGSYVETLRGRIQALALAHDQVVRGDGGGELGELLRAELGPHDGGRSAIVLEGAPVWLDARAFSVLALVFHELATNAAKYGTLSRQGGRLRVGWRIEGDGACRIDWQESGGPPVAPPARSGFGSVLIERSIPFDLGGRSLVAFDPGGVRAELLIPARFVRALPPAPAGPPPRAEAEAPAGGTLAGRRVLVVEDQMLIAMALEEELAEAGLVVAGVAAQVAAAMDLLGRETPDLAVLDLNLGAETSIPVAQELRARGVPFVFATGYGSGFTLPEELSDAAVVNKPYDVADILRKLTLAAGEG